MKRVCLVGLMSVTVVVTSLAGPNHARSRNDDVDQEHFVAVRPLDHSRNDAPAAEREAKLSEAGERWRERRKNAESLTTSPLVLFERKQPQIVVQPIVGKVNGAQFSLNFW